MRRFGWLFLAGMAGCVLSTETVSGPASDAGDSGTAETGAWKEGTDGGIYYADGNVGIGVPTPRRALQIYRAGAPDLTGIGYSGTGHVLIETDGRPAVSNYDTNNTSMSTLVTVAGDENDTNKASSISMLQFNANSTISGMYSSTCASALTFATSRGECGLQVGIPVEAMRVDASGNVGIGTTSPKARLHVAGGDIQIDDTHAVRGEGGRWLLGAIANSSTLSVGSLEPDVVGWNIEFNANATRMHIDATSGNVGVGTTTPTEKLHVEGNILATGTIKAMNFPDLAENITAMTPSIGPGDVVVSDPERGEGILLAAGPYSSTIIGVISTHPGILLNGEPADLDSARPRDKLQRPLALAGRVPVKVTLEGGPIHPGDLLTSSSTPGHAMRANEPWRGGLIGTALTAFSGKDDQGRPTPEGKVIVFLALDHTPSCNPEEQTRLTAKVSELEGKLAAEREAREALETRLKALEAAVLGNRSPRQASQ
ncbi:MAG: hypothetical protein U0359_37215 [Byssovorax sp.]